MTKAVMAHPDWVIGYGDEVWWSRFAQPNLHSWVEEEQQLRLVEQIICFSPIVCHLLFRGCRAPPEL